MTANADHTPSHDRNLWLHALMIFMTETDIKLTLEPMINAKAILPWKQWQLVDIINPLMHVYLFQSVPIKFQQL